MYTINSKIKKAIIFHHDDMDGQVAGKIAEHFLKEQDKKIDIKLYEVGYHKEVKLATSEFDHNTLVIITDYSFHLTVFDDLVNMVGPENIIWIDHHKSAIETYKMYPKLYLIDGLRYIGLSGAELTYHFFKHDIRTISQDWEIVPLPPTKKNIAKNVTNKTVIFEPLCLYLVGEWDTWRYDEDDPTAKQFSAGYLMKKPHLDDYSDEAENFWKLFYLQDAVYDVTVDEESMKYMDKTDEILNTGKVVNDYIAMTNKTSLQRFAFAAKIDKFPNIECVALNSTARSSLVFDNVKKHFHVGLVYSFNGKFMCYSIYRLDKDPDIKIDVSEIARCYGGGGHPGAAGFNTEHRLIVQKVGDIDEYLV